MDGLIGGMNVRFLGISSYPLTILVVQQIDPRDLSVMVFQHIDHRDLTVVVFQHIDPRDLTVVYYSGVARSRCV